MVFTQFLCLGNWFIISGKAVKMQRDCLPPTKHFTVEMNREQEKLLFGAFWTKQMTAKQRTNKRAQGLWLEWYITALLCCVSQPQWLHSAPLESQKGRHKNWTPD